MTDLQSQIAEHRKAGDLKEFCRSLHDNNEVAFKDACKKYLSYGEIKDCVYPIYQSKLDEFRKNGMLFEALFDRLNDGCFYDEDGYNEFLWIVGCEKYWEDVFAEPFDDLVLWPNLTVEERKEIKILQHFRLCEEIFADDDSYPGRSEYLEEVYDYCARLAVSPDESSNHKLFVYLLSYLDDENRAAFDKEIDKRIKAGGNSSSYKHIVM